MMGREIVKVRVLVEICRTKEIFVSVLLIYNCHIGYENSTGDDYESINKSRYRNHTGFSKYL